ncbi:putative ferric-chelate reductase 1 homolog [Chironomus tepperi]|uniref:putative ferric-chelate reductase 1 homolog n=1 Tax=Chironomus tepperi TaxID=113505 RepID=UPI00391F7ED6
MWLKVIYIVSFCILKAVSSPGGAPMTACGDMMPRHFDFQDQSGNLPVTFEAQSTIVSGQLLTIRIVGTELVPSFQGFQVQALTQTDEIIGSFQTSENVNVRDCNGIPGSTATHVNSNLKTAVEIIWIAPATTELITFNFHVTVLENIGRFWARRRMPLTVVAPPNLVPTEEPTSTIPVDPTVPTEDPTSTIPIDPTLPIEDPITIYDGCGDTKVCFGVPDNCYSDRSCDIIGAVTYQNPDFIFELLSLENHNYVAMGLSSTTGMGNASVIECVRYFQIHSYTSWTIEVFEAQRANVDQSIIDQLESSSIDGRIYCKVLRKAVTTVRGERFDLVNDKFYLLLASGYDIDVDTVMQHNNEGISYAPVRLTDPQYVRQNEPQNVLILIHGSFMIVSWIGLTSIGIVFARYFKKSWSNKKTCGQDVWFIWHVICMLLSWILTIAGFIIIFVYRGEWSTSAHAIMGCIVLGLTVIQPIGAVFRPDENSKTRSLFNWLHQAFGNITHALAVITIFFAVRFPEARLPHYTLYILAAFVSFYLLMHIIFTVIQVRGDMKRDVNSRTKNPKPRPFQLILKTLLGFFIVSMMIFVIALLLVFILDFDY